MDQLNAFEEFVVVDVVVGVAVVNGVDAADVVVLHAADDEAAAAAVAVVEDDGQYQGAEFDSYKLPT